MCTLYSEHYQDMQLTVATQILTEYQEYTNYTNTHTEDGQALKLIYVNPSVTICFGAVAQRGLRLPHLRRFQIIHSDAPQSVGILWTSYQPPCRDHYLTRTQNLQQTEFYSNLTGFEPVIPARERSEAYALGRAVTGTGLITNQWLVIVSVIFVVLLNTVNYSQFITNDVPIQCG